MTISASAPSRTTVEYVDVDTGELAAPVLDIVVPVFNERHDLAPSVRRLRAYLDAELPATARITIVDNASTDGTWSIARELAVDVPMVRALRLAERGRGRALHAAWGASDAAVLAYTDVDLSTDLAALPPLVAPLLSGHSDLAIGTRLSRSARVVRGPKRELISRAYNVVLHAVLRTGFSDAQCGFKAIRRDRAQLLLPLVKDNDWFFDTELLVIAERAGLRIHEVPVDWVDHADSRVDIASTALADLRGIARLSRGLASGTIPLDAVAAHARLAPPQSTARQAARFATIGAASTAAYLFAYLALRTLLPAIVANGIALLLTAIANTTANRRLTFGVVTRERWLRHQVQGLVVFGIALAVTTASLGLLHATASPTRAAELAVLVLANLAATVVRFVLLRGWVFRPTRTTDSQRPHRE
jgi:putative flippase GtrA